MLVDPVHTLLAINLMVISSHGSLLPSPHIWRFEASQFVSPSLGKGPYDLKSNLCKDEANCSSCISSD